MEEALREREEWYRTLVENSFDGIFVQRGFKIIFANLRLHQMLGYSVGELEGLDHWSVYHPDYRQITRERAAARMRGEEVVSHYEVKLQRKDGTSFEGEVSARAVTVKGEPGVQVWVRDVSKPKRSEEVQRRLATAVEQAAEAIVVTDTNGDIQYVNPAFEKISGYTREEVIGRNPRLLASGEQDSIFYDDLWGTITGGEVWTGRFTNRKKDGSLYHEEATISPVRDSTGRVTNFVAVKRDVTEHLRLSNQLFQAQKMEAVGTLAGGIAHDFNNLLQVTLGYSEMLLADKDRHDPEYEDLSRILQAAKSGAELVQRLLTFSRKVEPKPVPLNLNRRIVQVDKLLKRTIPKMIDIQMNLSNDLATVNADPLQMEQVLMNLAVNARDAMPDGGKLIIETRNISLDEEHCRADVGARPGNYVLLTVSDTGHGIDKAIAEHIFEPFYTTKELGRGTGLGLAMVYGIVSQHGGFIRCSSEVGRGTAFNVYFPAIENLSESAVEMSAVRPAFGTETILLVDDEELVRDLGERVLTKAGYTVLSATNGIEALELFKKERKQIDLVILDLIMPEMGGKACLKELLKMDPEVRILLASGYAADAAANKTLEPGARGFVGKPFRFMELLRQVRNVLDGA
jgi:PAS domain S-box-containing protein